MTSISERKWGWQVRNIIKKMLMLMPEATCAQLRVLTFSKFVKEIKKMLTQRSCGAQHEWHWQQLHFYYSSRSIFINQTDTNVKLKNFNFVYGEHNMVWKNWCWWRVRSAEIFQHGVVLSSVSASGLAVLINPVKLNGKHMNITSDHICTSIQIFLETSSMTFSARG